MYSNPRNFMKLILFCLLLLAIPYGVSAQKLGLLSGRVLAEQSKENGAYRMWDPMAGATAQLVTSTRDTLLLVTDREGVFTFKQIPQGRAFLEVSFIGYQTLIDTVVIARNTILSFLEMKPDTKKIEEVVVKGKIPLVNRVGDTLIYNAAAMPTLQGDDAIRIVEQMPGAQVSDGGVKIQGENIARSYVNGKLVFGDDAMSVLNNLLASNVAKIKVYDELTDADRRAGRTNGRKQKVLDVVTKSPILSAVTGHFLASMGADMDRGSDGSRRLRYGAGVTSNFFSEKLLVGVNTFANNIGRRSNRLSEIIESGAPPSGYNEDKLASVVIEKYWGDRRDGSSLRGGYTYTDNASQTRSVSRRRYFKTDSNPEMEYNDTTSSDSKRYSHAAFVDVDLHGHKSKFLSGIRWTNKFDYETGEQTSMNSMNILSDKGMDYTNTRSRNRSDGYSIDEGFSWSRYDNHRLPRFRATARISDNTDNGWRVDTLSSTKTRRVLESDGDYFTQQYQWSASVQLLKPHEPNTEEKPKFRFNMLELEYEGGYENSRKRKLALNTDEEFNAVDTANTMNYTYNYLAHKFSAMLGTGYLSGVMFNVTVGVDYLTPRKEEHFPEEYTYSKHFVLPSASVNFFRVRNGVNIMCFAAVRGTVPSIEQITARINDLNPLQLSAGNPNLKATQRYDMALNWTKTFDLTGKEFEFRVSGGYVRNAITTRSRFFAESTTLPDWENYQTQANATLSTFENVSGNANANLDVGYSFRLGRWMTVRANLNGAFDRNRSFVGDALSTTDSYAPSGRLYLNGTLAQKFAYNVIASSRYAYSENTLRDASRNLGWECGASMRYDPLKWLFGQVEYNYSAQKFYTQTGTDRNAHLLNALVGFRAYKGMFTVSVSVYDVLNKGTSFSSSMQGNYMLDTLTPSFGRYYLVNLGVKFNRNKSGKEYKGQIGDGSSYGRMRGMSSRMLMR